MSNESGEILINLDASISVYIISNREWFLGFIGALDSVLSKKGAAFEGPVALTLSATGGDRKFCGELESFAVGLVEVLELSIEEDLGRLGRRLSVSEEAWPIEPISEIADPPNNDGGFRGAPKPTRWR